MQRAATAALAALLPALAAGSTPVLAQQDPLGTRRGPPAECCVQLLAPVGARATALANTLVSRPGPDGLFVNPAALSGLERDEFRIHNADAEIEASNAFGLAFRVRGAGVLGLTYRLSDYGDSQATDALGNPTGTLRVLDHYLIASFATALGHGLAAGVSYKMFQFRQDCTGFCVDGSFAATTHGLDFGMQYHPPLWPALQLGAAVTHAGLALQVLNAEQADPMPTRVRIGAAYEVLQHFTADTSMVLWATANVAGSWREGVQPRAGLGLELVMDHTIFIRTGYATGAGREAGAAVGVGLRYDRFDVGIARSFLGATGAPDPFQITFAVGF
jgi:hypothetical protein